MVQQAQIAWILNPTHMHQVVLSFGTNRLQMTAGDKHRISSGYQVFKKQIKCSPDIFICRKMIFPPANLTHLFPKISDKIPGNFTINHVKILSKKYPHFHISFLLHLKITHLCIYTLFSVNFEAKFLIFTLDG